MPHRAVAILHVKEVSDDKRIISGVATSPTADRIGDIVEPRGATFKNPVPLLLFHDGKRPVGTAKLQKATDEGIRFEAHIPEIEAPGTLKDRVDEAWQSIKAGLIRGVSIGFRVLDDGIELLRNGGVRFTATEILELSLVSVPANVEAVIDSIKSYDTQYRAASGDGQGDSTKTARATATTRMKATTMAKTITEQIAGFEATRKEKVDKRAALMTKAGDEGVTLDAAEAEEYNSLKTEIKSIDDHLVRLRELEEENKAAAVAAKGANEDEASRSRATSQATRITVKSTRPPGIGLARALLCKMASFMAQGSASPLDFAKARYADDHEVHMFLKADVLAGTTVGTTWAAPLVDQTTLTSEFIEYLRPMTILGKFGTNGIPALRRLPFNVRIPRQTSGGTGYWVGEGAPKPLTSFAFDAVTLAYTKVAAITVITQELARFSSPSAETIVRDQLARALVERIDVDFIDPGRTAVANVNPASITNGLTSLGTAGTSADNARTDIQNLIEQFILNNQSPANLVLIMPNTLALALGTMVNSLGQPEFPGLDINGGRLRGIPVITSQYAANTATFGNLLIAVDADAIGLADDGQVDVEVSREASLQMLDNPTNNSATPTPTTMVSMYQTNSLAIKAERFINWVKLRSTAVVMIDDVNWGAIGSPA